MFFRSLAANTTFETESLDGIDKKWDRVESTENHSSSSSIVYFIFYYSENGKRENLNRTD